LTQLEKRGQIGVTEKKKGLLSGPLLPYEPRKKKKVTGAKGALCVKEGKEKGQHQGSAHIYPKKKSRNTKERPRVGKKKSRFSVYARESNKKKKKEKACANGSIQKKSLVSRE